MSRLKLIKLADANGKARPLLEAAKSRNGKEINLVSAFANAPAVLASYLSFASTLSEGALDPGLREKIAVATAGYNRCNYCASAHTYIGQRLGISNQELSANLVGASEDSKSSAALDFAMQLVSKRGHIDDNDMNSVRNAGYSDEEIVEIVAHVALNTFTNYFNVAFQVEVDFPLVVAE